MNRIAIFLPNWIGDAVMATPAIRAVRSEFPQAEITAVVRPYVADVLDGLHRIDRRMIWDPKSNNPVQRGWRLAAALRRERFDIALLLPNSIRSAWMARLSGAKRRVGFRRDGRGWLLTDGVTPQPKTRPHPVIDEYLRLAQHLGCRNLSRTMELATLPGDELRLHNFWRKTGLLSEARLLLSGDESQYGWTTEAESQPYSTIEKPGFSTAEQPGFPSYICLNPGGAFGAAKHWPDESFGALARRIAVELGRAVLVACGPAERDAARRIVQHAGHPAVVSLANEPPSIGLTKAAVKHAELLVTTDSGPRHFAAPFGVPVVTLFGPTHIAWSETFYPQAVHLQEAVDCGPCQQRVCPLQHHRCMRDLSPDRAFAAVCSLLGERQGVSPPRKITA